MDENKRSVAKRQLARLLGGSSLPIVVISEEDTVVFANDAMGNLVGQTPDSILGLRCSSPISADGDVLSELSTFFALPIHWSRRFLKITEEFGPFPGATGSTTSNQPNLNCEGWTRCLIPLTDAAGCVLCIFCPISSATEREINGQLETQSSLNMKTLRENRNKYIHLDDMWYLQGKSAGAHRALEQAQAAIANSAPLIVYGAMGSGRTWIAETVHDKRKQLRSNEKVSSMSEPLVRIDCSLMDTDLLQSMLEVVHESNANRQTVMLDGLDSLPAECISRLEFFFKSHPGVFRIATFDPSKLELTQSRDLRWRDLLAQISVMRIDMPNLADRLEDVSLLVAAWFDSRKTSGVAKREISQGFVDALTAYPWPGGVEEFSDAMDHANKSDSMEKLTEKDLPVNIRTCVSHIELSSGDTPVDLDAILEDVEKTMILRALERFPQNKSAAAKLLNISRARLLRRLQQWGLQSESNSIDGEDDLPVFNEVV